jgi:hypothetical protein
MLAATLPEALNALAPDRALSTPDELQTLYVARPNSPLRPLELLLRSSRDSQKILFTGHRGSGKTTELAKLRLLLKDEFFIFRYSITDRLNLYDITYVDVLLALGLELFQTAVTSGLRLDNALYDQMLSFTKELSTTVSTSPSFAGEIGGEINFLIAKLNAKLKIEDQTRKEVREKVSPRLSTLLETVNLLARSIQAETHKRVMAIVEDLDKVDPAIARQLFYDHGTSLSAPRLSVIYTFPIALRHDNNYGQVKMSFPETYVLPIFKPRMKDGSPNEHAILKCEEILTRRVDPALIEPAARRALAESCGGVTGLLIALSRQACLEAMVDDKPVIDIAAVNSAIRNARRDYEVLLNKNQLATLKKVHRTKQVNNDEEYRELLHNLSCLEYRNDDVWYDVHPVVQPLL